jgi:RNA recognition motif-containing protein
MSQQSKIYAGNLPYDTKEADLEAFFGEYGNTTEIKIIKDNATGRSKGYAFITFEKQQDALTACEEANGKDLEGRKIRVNMARDNNRNGGRGGSRGGRGGSRFGGGGNWNSDRERY